MRRRSGIIRAVEKLQILRVLLDIRQTPGEKTGEAQGLMSPTLFRSHQVPGTNFLGNLRESGCQVVQKNWNANQSL